MFIRRNVQCLWGGAHVLAWHLERSFRNDSAAWAKNRCVQWDILEEKLPKFVDELEDCPCTLAQARADTGRFYVSSDKTLHWFMCRTNTLYILLIILIQFVSANILFLIE